MVLCGTGASRMAASTTVTFLLRSNFGPHSDRSQLTDLKKMCLFTGCGLSYTLENPSYKDFLAFVEYLTNFNLSNGVLEV